MKENIQYIKELEKNGVVFKSYDGIYISSDAKIGKGTEIYPNVIIEEKTTIGENCKIYPNSRIIKSNIGNNNIIDSSVVEESEIANNVKIGPFAHLRPNSIIKDHAKIGNFVEIKNSVIGENSKASHLAYVGDADVGKNVNIGCGVIFVNYNGVNKFRSNIGDNVFVGSNSNIVAPVNIQKNSFIAAGSTITIDLEENNFVVARAREYVKKDWNRPNKK